jgi:hypothetical protein
MLFGVNCFISCRELIEIWKNQPFVIIDLFFGGKSWEFPYVNLLEGMAQS